MESRQTLDHKLKRFLVDYYGKELWSIINSTDPRIHYPLVVEFIHLMEFDPSISNLIHTQPTVYLPIFDAAAKLAQIVKLSLGGLEKDENASVKEFVHIRISPLGFPGENFPNIGKIRVKYRGVLLTLKGTVIRSGGIKMIEGEKMYECRKCKHREGKYGNSLHCFTCFTQNSHVQQR